jgi:hypothetical protein
MSDADTPDDETDERRPPEDMREQVVDELGEAHAVAVAYVRFPREENDVSEVDSSLGLFMFNDELSETEEIAALSLIEDGTADLADRANQDDDGNAVAMPAPPGLAEALSGMAAGGDGSGEQPTDAERRGFQ